VTSGRCQIREATDQDLDVLVGLLSLLFSPEADFDSDPVKQAAGLRLLMGEPRRGSVLVTEDDGEVVGMCSVQTTLSTVEGAEAALVEDVAVRPEHRGHGLGRSLVAGTEDWCLSRGIRRMQLLMDRDNGPAAFYRHLGWAETRLVACRKRLPSES